MQRLSLTPLVGLSTQRYLHVVEASLAQLLKFDPELDDTHIAKGLGHTTCRPVLSKCICCDATFMALSLTNLGAGFTAKFRFVRTRGASDVLQVCTALPPPPHRFSRQQTAFEGCLPESEQPRCTPRRALKYLTEKRR